MALLGFLCVDSGFRASLDSGGFDQFEAANHRWTWWQAKGYKELPYTPDVVMFGSSLLARIINQGEATYLKRSINSTKHNHSQQLEDLVASKTGVPVTTYAFNLSGLHASDAAVLVSGLLKSKTPSTIVYTIAPRDLLDNLLEAPYTTEQFELMSHSSDLGELASKARLSTMDKVHYWFIEKYNRASALGKCKTELATTFERTYRQFALPLLDAHVPSVDQPLTAGKVGLKIAAFDFPESVTVEPEDPNKIELNDNLQCYRFCYQPFRPKIYNNQLFYLDYLLKFAQERGVKVILVNMPLRRDNLTAMIPNFLELYKSDIANHAAKYGARVVDLLDGETFPDSDFCDTVHLTGHGAVKFVNKMAEQVAPEIASTAVASARNSKAHIAGREAANPMAY